MTRMIAVATAAAVAILSLAAPASAQLAYVSATGNDANNCFAPTTPCKTLQRGINQTATGGELRVLSQVISNGFINRSMTIDAQGQTIIGSLVVDSPSAVVAFRRIVLTGRGIYPTGFDIRNAAAVHIEDGTAERFTQYGIRIGANTAAEVFVSDSVSRDNGVSGLSVHSPTTMKLAVDNSHFENNGDRGLHVGGGDASVSRSVFSGNLIGISLIGGTIIITDSVASGNPGGGFDAEGGRMTVEGSTSKGNDYGLYVADGVTVQVSKSTFTQNTTGLEGTVGATVLSDGTNVVDDNGTNVDPDLFDGTLNLY